MELHAVSERVFFVRGSPGLGAESVRHPLAVEAAVIANLDAVPLKRSRHLTALMAQD